MKCPKCEGDTEKGIRLDASYGQMWTEQWIKESNISLVKDEKRIKLKSDIFGQKSQKNSLVVKTFRCKECGYLESYAK